MKKTTAVIAAAIGVGTLIYASNTHHDKFTNEAIWARQSPMVERFLKETSDKEAVRAELKTDLKAKMPDDTEGRCNVERLFQATIKHKRDKAAAQKELASQSFDEKYPCQVEATSESRVFTGLNVVGWGLVLIGAIGFVASIWKSLSGAEKPNRSTARHDEPPHAGPSAGDGF